MKLPLHLFLASLLTFGCASSTTEPSPSTDSTRAPLEATDYSQDCNVDADCLPIFEGDPCADPYCLCANAAVAASAKAAYNSSLQKALLMCPGKGGTCNCPAESVSCVPATKKCKLN